MSAVPATYLAEEIRRFDPGIPIEKAWMPPASWYTNAELNDLERRSVLHRTWQPVARVTELVEPGSYKSGCLAGEPWVVVRGDDGELRAFHNTCRHKGREVVQGTGRAPTLVCGYHAWEYDLRGKLRSAPRIAGIEDFDRDAMSLRPLAVDTWGPWVFVNGDVGATPMKARLPELDARLEATNWNGLTYVERTTWELGCNWKVYVDNYLDGGYHIPHMHPTLDAQLDMSTYRTDIYAESSIQTSEPSRSEDERIGYEAKERIGPGAIYAWIYPNFMLNRYGPCLDSNWVVPLGPDRCRVEYEFWFRETEGDAAREFIRSSIDQAAVTQREDISICESVQVGLSSSSYDRGRYAPRVEVGEHHFHRLLSADLRNALRS